MLERKGIQAACVYDSERGKEYAELGVYDLLIRDVMMPKVNSYRQSGKCGWIRTTAPYFVTKNSSSVCKEFDVMHLLL